MSVFGLGDSHENATHYGQPERFGHMASYHSPIVNIL